MKKVIQGACGSTIEGQSDDDVVRRRRSTRKPTTACRPTRRSRLTL
jgi:hypothetical protein